MKICIVLNVVLGIYVHQLIGVSTQFGEKLFRYSAILLTILLYMIENGIVFLCMCFCVCVCVSL